MSQRLEKADLLLTELGYGAAALGNLSRAISDDQAHAAVTAAYELGVRYFDTAPHYGLGLSERRLGAALANRPRDSFAISTKVGRLLAPNQHPTGSDLMVGGFDVPDDLVRHFNFSRDGVRRSLEASLDRLGLTHVDIAYIHDPDDQAEQAIKEAVPALAELRDEGVVTAIGIGMNQWQVPLRIVREADIDAVMLAARWTLLDRSGERLLDECLARQVRVIAAAPYNSGLLATDRPSADSTYDYHQPPRALLQRVHAMADACERSGVGLPAAALQFPVQHPVVVSVVAGARTAHEVRQSVDRLEAPIPPPLWRDLDALAHASPHHP